MSFVSIEGIVEFSANNGVMLTPKALETEPEHLKKLVELAFKHLADEPLLDACCGNRGPLASYHQLDYQEYLRICADIDRKKKAESSTRLAKLRAMQERRKEFALNRPEIILAMLASGIVYACAVDGCESEDLKIDHILPLSKGGLDDVENLQFLCASHNSAKGDRR